MKTAKRLSSQVIQYTVFCIIALIGVIALAGGLFVFNGLVLTKNETPLSGVTSHPPSVSTSLSQIKILAYNIAKGFVHKGGISFRDRDVVTHQIQKIAEVIIAEQPDLVFLSEIVFECSPCPVNQVISLAEATGMHAWAFGENYNFGLPFYRIVGGNAVLSTFPLEPVENPSLAGRKPFYVTTNNRRMLWCATQIAGQRVLLTAVHTDSYNLANNLAQTRQLLDYAGEQAAIMAGDFNAQPHESSIQLIRKSNRFTGAFDGPLTFPAKSPEQTIDFIFVPAHWELTEHHVVQSQASDHLSVVSTFRIPAADR